MPFVHDQTEIKWPDDGSDPAPPRSDQFIYIPPPEFGGAREPVRFSVSSMSDPTDASAAQQPTERQPPTPTRPERRGILDRLLGRPAQSGSARRSQSAYDEDKQRSQRLHEQRRQQLFAIMIPVLREIGGQRAYCRYDGGNDEGFAWLDSIEMRNGERIDADALAQRLCAIRAQGKLYDTKIVKRSDSLSEAEQLKDLVQDWLCSEWASMLLGDSYGTGEYSMYGAFTVDLEACTITDDRNADPVVENIEIAT